MRTQNGFSLIEVLVAVVILAIGILGIAGLQVVSLQQNRGALIRAQALQLGNSMPDRMRANPEGDYADIAYGDPPAASRDCRDVTCNPDDMAEFDIAQWKCSINSTDGDGDPFSLCEDYDIPGTLPRGEGAIALNGAVHEVSIRWQESEDGSTFNVTLRARTE